MTWTEIHRQGCMANLHAEARDADLPEAVLQLDQARAGMWSWRRATRLHIATMRPAPAPWQRTHLGILYEHYRTARHAAQIWRARVNELYPPNKESEHVAGD